MKVHPSSSQKLSPYSAAQDALAVLRADHRQINRLLDEFGDIGPVADPATRAELVAAICTALTVHDAIEEEIFYPAVRAVLNDDDMLDDAQVDHAEVRSLIAQLRAMQPDDALYGATVGVLAELFEQHVDDEEGGLFNAVKKVQLDIDRLGVKLRERRRALHAALGTYPE